MPRFFALIFTLALILSGCAQQPKKIFIEPGRTDSLVHSIEIEGNDFFSSGTIKRRIVTYVDPGWRAKVENVPIFGAEHSYFNPLTWEKDKLRILTMYRANGFFNAKITRSEIMFNDNQSEVNLRIAVSEGKQTKVRSLNVAGIDELGIPLETIIDEIEFKVGDPMVEANYLRAKDRLVKYVRNQSYAYATLSGRVFVDPKNDAADVYFFLDAGPKCNFGEVTIEGLEDVDPDYVRDAITIEKGEPYATRAIQETQARIYGLGVFSVVKVAPASEFKKEDEEQAILQEEDGSKDAKERRAEDDARGVGASTVEAPPVDGQVPGQDPHPTDLDRDIDTEVLKEAAERPEGNYFEQRVADRVDAIEAILNAAQDKVTERTKLDTTVPIIVRVREAKMFNIRVGAGLYLDPQRASVKVRLDWTHRNFLGGMRKIEHFNEVGYMWADNKSSIFPNFKDPSNQGVSAKSDLHFTQPQFLERLLEARVNIGFKREIEPNWTLMSPTFQIGLRRTWFGHLRTDLSYNASLHYLSNLKVEDSPTRPPSSYVLEFMEARVTLDYLDSVLNPMHGVVAETMVQYATRYFGQIPGIDGGDFDYLHAMIGVKGYINYKLGIEQVIAMRAKLASIYTFGRGELAPLPQRLYGGGPDSIRSFSQRQFAIYSADKYGIYPVGGFTQAELSLEPRFMIVPELLDIGDFWGAIYVDAATILPGQFLFETDANKKACSNPKGCVETFKSVGESLIYGVGAALWWITPVGPVRADFAYTVSNFKDDKRFRECFSKPDARGYCTAAIFYPKDDDIIRKALSSWSFYLGIGHTF